MLHLLCGSEAHFNIFVSSAIQYISLVRGAIKIKNVDKVQTLSCTGGRGGVNHLLNSEIFLKIVKFSKNFSLVGGPNWHINWVDKENNKFDLKSLAITWHLIIHNNICQFIYSFIENKQNLFFPYSLIITSSKFFGGAVHRKF